MVTLQIATVQSPKEGAHGRCVTIPIKAHFQTVDSSLIIFHLYTDKNVHMIHLTRWYLYFYWQKSMEKSQVRLWCCIPLLFRYINNQIWRAANKNRINLISILISLQATGLEKQNQMREICTCSVFPPAVCPLACTVPSLLHSHNTHSRETSLYRKTSRRPAKL